MKLRLIGKAAFAFIALLAGTLPASAGDKPLRVALYALPDAGGIPFVGIIQPTIFVWPAIFDGLTQIERDGTVVPALAVSWQAVDELNWRFSLRPNVKFSNGEAFNAQAVAETIAILQKPESARYGVVRESSVIESVRAIDALTLEIKTKTPAPFLPAVMSAIRIVEPKQWRALGPEGFARAPVGTGPFKVMRWEPAKVTLSANTSSWRPPKVSLLELLAIPDTSSRTQALLAGAVDIAVALGPDDVPAVESGGARVQVRSGGAVISLAFNTKAESPLRDVRVRRALNYAVNKQAIVDGLLQGQSVPASQGAPRIAFGFDPQLAPYPHDPARARALLSEAGVAQGFDLTIEVAVGGAPNDAAVYQQVVADLAAVGLRPKLQIVPVAQLSRGIVQGEWRGTMFSMDFTVFPTMDALAPMRIHSCLWHTPWYCDETIVPKIKQALASFDPQKRASLTREVLAYTRDHPPALFLHEVIGYDGIAADIAGYDAAFALIKYDRIHRVAR